MSGGNQENETGALENKEGSGMINDFVGGRIIVPAVDNQHSPSLHPTFITVGNTTSGFPKIQLGLWREERRHLNFSMGSGAVDAANKPQEEMVMTKIGLLELDISLAVRLIELVGKRLDKLPPEILAMQGVQASSDTDDGVDKPDADPV